jgi:broad specificity phosphatase PhoE
MLKAMISEFKTWFGLIRHGKTQWNLEKRIQGSNDTNLCSEGIEQVEKWGKILNNAEKWDRIVVSGLCRTWETAEIINKELNLPIEKYTRLNEQDWGVWNGKTYQDLILEQPKELERQMTSGWRFCPPGGEDRLSLWNRSVRVFNDMAVRWPGQKILVISHGGVIRTLIYGTMKRQFLQDEPSLIKPYHLHILIWENEGLKIEALNAVCLD